ncbi:unnamed protein product [Caenorhabditis angaria]|uniref:Serpentine receptor class r-10 n=1 Tax=Caenorhabditis angaria TaxID=860376 RepID=A0A9P1IY68_9PELO|nr:unnamed protein product [Caenorhabditis angaria]
MKIPLATVAAEYVGFIVAFFANIFLIFLIVTQTRQNFGAYKNLMLWFTVFSLWYSFIDILTQPGMHSYKNSYIVFCASWFKYHQLLAPIIITSYCTSYGLTLVLLAIHFIYRFIAISRPNQMYYFKYPRVFLWPTVFITIAIFWWCNVYFFLGRNQVIDEYMQKSIEENYEDDIRKLSYIGPLYFIISPGGKIEIQWKSCVGMANVYTIAATTFVLITTLGLGIYKKMQSVQSLIAPKTRELQKQLFHSLIVQTIVPIIFMYTPTTILFIAPIFGIELGSMANITSICLALYPALDPLVVMYFIRDYRKYIIKHITFSNNVSSTRNVTHDK